MAEQSLEEELSESLDRHFNLHKRLTGMVFRDKNADEIVKMTKAANETMNVITRAFEARLRLCAECKIGQPDDAGATNKAPDGRSRAAADGEPQGDAIGRPAP